MKSVLFIIIPISFLISCEKEPNTPPEVAFTIFPSIVDTSTFVRFDGSTTVDHESHIWFLKFRWDYDGDGTWDTEYIQNPVSLWQYHQTGTYSAVAEALDEGGLTATDTSEIVVMANHVQSSFTDPRDGNMYRIVLVDELWWFAENLRFGIAINPGTLPRKDAITEKYVVDSTQDKIDIYGGYYTWGELTEYDQNYDQGICPPGWRVTTAKDLRKLNRFSSWGDGKYYLGIDGYLGTDLIFGGYYALIDKKFHRPEIGYLWVTDHVQNMDGIDQSIGGYGYNYKIGIQHEEWSLDENPSLRTFWPLEWGNKMDFNKLAFNVRCVKNRD